MKQALNPHFRRTRSIYVRAAARTDIGLARNNNEDAYAVADLTAGATLGDKAVRYFEVGERGILLAVSDGVGGQRAGEVASSIVIEKLITTLSQAPPELSGATSMKTAVQEAHRAVREAACTPDRAKMSATLTAVLIRDNRATIAEVGDSRAYLLRSGALTQLTRDQSVVQRLVEEGVLEPGDAERSPLRNVILQAMGQQQSVHAALGELELRNRDCLVLCTDGLTHAVSDNEIRQVILASPQLEDACQQLVHLANSRGGKDNVTIITAGLGGELQPSHRADKMTFNTIQSFEPRIKRFN